MTLIQTIDYLLIKGMPTVALVLIDVATAPDLRDHKLFEQQRKLIKDLRQINNPFNKWMVETVIRNNFAKLIRDTNLPFNY
jgi:hypothetical protein